MPSRPYLLTAALPGLLWLVVLHVPATTRQFITGMGHGTAGALLCLLDGDAGDESANVGR